MSRIVRTPAASRDVASIAGHIAANNLDAAMRFIDALDEILELVLKYPQLGQAVDELHPGVRRHTLGNYLVFYRPTDEGIELLRVLHGAQDIRTLS